MVVVVAVVAVVVAVMVVVVVVVVVVVAGGQNGRAEGQPASERVVGRAWLPGQRESVSLEEHDARHYL